MFRLCFKAVNQELRFKTCCIVVLTAQTNWEYEVNWGSLMHSPRKDSLLVGNDLLLYDVIHRWIGQTNSKHHASLFSLSLTEK